MPKNLKKHSLRLWVVTASKALVFGSVQAPNSATGKVVLISETRLGDLLDFGELFKAFGNN